MEKIISVYWFVILIIVAGGIVFMVSNFYGKPYDVRDIESSVMADNIADCISKNGRLIYPMDDEEFKRNFLQVCHININTQSDEIQYYIEVSFYNFENSQSLGFDIKEGNPNLKNNPNKKSIFSTTKSFYTLNKDQESVPQEIFVNIFIAINKAEKNT